MLRRHVEIVSRPFRCGRGIRRSTMLGEEFGVVVFVGVFFGAEEEHVFAEMGKAWQIIRVV